MAVVQFKRPAKVDNKSSGFAMNSRDILETDWYKNINARLIYLELSLRVSHSVHKTTFNGNDITLCRGQYVTTEINLAKVIQADRNKAAWALKVLEKSGVISRQKIGKLNNKCTVITLNLDEKAQLPQQPPEQQASNHVSPLKQKAVRVAATTEQPPEQLPKQPQHQEVSTTRKETYVQNDIKNASALLVTEVVKLYNESFPELASVAKVSPQRKSRLLKIINDKFTLPNGDVGTFRTIEDWVHFFDWMKQSDWLMGRTASNWQMTFDFMVNPTNFLKIIEGNYENKGGYDHD